MTTCQECARPAEWLVVVAGQEWIDRFCWRHLTGSRYVTKQYEVFPVSRAVSA